jgi:hypothetical protein
MSVQGDECNGTSKVSAGGCASESASCSGIGGDARKGGEKAEEAGPDK